MKILYTFIILSLALTANMVNAAQVDLVGTWQVDSACLRIGDNMDYTAPGVINIDPHQIVITWQNQGLFKGYSCDAEVPNGIFFGAFDGKKISVTSWDSITSGSLNGHGNAIDFISQNQLWNPDSAPATCMGTATKISDTFDCNPVMP